MLRWLSDVKIEMNFADFKWGKVLGIVYLCKTMFALSEFEKIVKLEEGFMDVHSFNVTSYVAIVICSV